MATFINREKETQFLTNWMNREPNSLLFVYGPKSSGKTTLINKFIEGHLDKKAYAVNYINLRQVLVYNFQGFLDTFFQRSKGDKLKEVVAGITMNIGFFSVSMDDEAIFKKNPFKLMIDQLHSARKKGIRPVIVIDEIQTLKGIYFNGERVLLDELINLFVALTKELHYAHVVLLTSDSYFIEEIYTHAKLKKTTEFFFVDHLLFPDVKSWLLAENINEEDTLKVWKLIGGSAWEITQIIARHKEGENIESSCWHFINDEYAKLVEFIRTSTLPEESDLLTTVHRDIATNGFALATAYSKEINPLIPKMVEHDFWFFRTDTQQITANSESIRWAIKKIIE